MSSIWKKIKKFFKRKKSKTKNTPHLVLEDLWKDRIHLGEKLTPHCDDSWVNGVVHLERPVEIRTVSNRYKTRPNIEISNDTYKKCVSKNPHFSGIINIQNTSVAEEDSVINSQKRRIYLNNISSNGNISFDSRNTISVERDSVFSLPKNQTHDNSNLIKNTITQLDSRKLESVERDSVFSLPKNQTHDNSNLIKNTITQLDSRKLESVERDSVFSLPKNQTYDNSNLIKKTITQLDSRKLGSVERDSVFSLPKNQTHDNRNLVKNTITQFDSRNTLSVERDSASSSQKNQTHDNSNLTKKKITPLDSKNPVKKTQSDVTLGHSIINENNKLKSDTMLFADLKNGSHINNKSSPQNIIKTKDKHYTDFTKTNTEADIKNTIRHPSTAESFKKNIKHETKNITKENNNIPTCNELHYENFRNIPLFPIPGELTGKKVIHLQKNIINGKYENMEQYLNIQIRLLRADYINPLRENVLRYMKLLNMNSITEEETVERRCFKVKFIGLERTGNTAGLRISLNLNDQQKESLLENNNLFMNGSLLCFTRDNFQNIFYCTVLVRKEDDLLRGELVVSIPNNLESYLSQDTHSGEFVMVESSAFFEPYYHVMKTLQNMSCKNFPMEKYILKVQNSNINLPKYFHSNRELHATLNKLLDQSMSELKMNKYQCEAYMTALKNEFVIIQGPPGTGKSYVSLKISETLLKIQNVLNKYEDNTPILIVCYTNHALDQFMEGILKFTNNIIRVGGNCKSEDLTKFNFVHKRKNYHLLTEEWHTFQAQKTQLMHILRKAKALEKSIQMIEEKKHVVSSQSFNMVMNQGRQFKFSDKLLLEWLTSDADNSLKVIFNFDENCGERRGKSKNNRNENNLGCSNLKMHYLQESISELIEQGDPESFNDDFYDIEPHINFALNINDLELELQTKQSATTDIYANTHNKDIRNLQNCIQFFNMQMKKTFFYNKHLVSQFETGSVDLWTLSNEQRWCLYSNWVDYLKKDLLIKFQQCLEDLKRVSEQCNLIQKGLDVGLMKDASVIGMTTTGAAKLQPKLELLQLKIVIVEEAAEVLESHVIASLTRHCQHLILIGDHKQLRPRTEDYGLTRRYQTDVSLFERMVKNDVHCEVLKTQYRMRPEIARVIMPAIYPELYNDDSVYSFDDVFGVSENVFFFNHNEPETEEKGSKINMHEAKFLIAFCKHLLWQGYSPHEITMLTTYSAQVALLNKLRDGRKMRKVKITTVDNFQGEETNIVLLSLVRSNDGGNIGFLREDCRICVALSRARQGLYIIGNMDSLSRRNETWKKIKKALQEQDSIDSGMSLYCKFHPDGTDYDVEDSYDVLKYIKRGRCSLICGTKLKCGHICKKKCHYFDREHEKDFQCSDC